MPLHGFGLTSEEAERLLAFGAVYQDRQRVTADRRLAPGQYIRVHSQPKRFPVEGIDWQATIVHRNIDFVVVNKPGRHPRPRDPGQSGGGRPASTARRPRRQCLRNATTGHGSERTDRFCEDVAVSKAIIARHRLIGTIRRKCLDQSLFWTTADLEAKLLDFQHYYNEHRVHAGLEGRRPEPGVDRRALLMDFGSYRWQRHWRGFHQTPIAA